MSNNPKNSQRKNVKSNPPRPMVIDAKTWKSIVNRGDSTLTLLEEEKEKKYIQYLKTESDKLKRQWPDYIDHNLAQELPSAEEIRKNKELDRMNQARDTYKRIKEKTERDRMEKIARAQEMIQRSQSGPRELDSAMTLSEVMRAREIMAQVKAEFQKCLDEKSSYDLIMLKAQNPSWIAEEQKRMLDEKKRNLEYRQELRLLIMEREMEESRVRKEILDMEKRQREIENQKTKQLKENELIALKKLKSTLLKDAEQSKLMSEQRRSLKMMEEKVDDCINEIYNKGKDRIKAILKENEKRLNEERNLRKKQNEEIYLAQSQPQQGITCQENADFFEKITKNENERLQKEKELREQRIRFHLEEQKIAKDLEEIKRENDRFQKANRIKNEELQYEFEKSKIHDHQAKLKMFKESLLEQIKDKKCRQQYEKRMDQLCTEIDNQDDHFFLHYADLLLNDARKKNRPTFPILKAIERYKKDNAIGIHRKLPEHLKSKVPIDSKTQ